MECIYIPNLFPLFASQILERNYSGDTSNYLDKWLGTMQYGSDESHQKMLSRLKLN